MNQDFPTSAEIKTRNYLQRTSKNVFTFGYGMPKDSLDIFNTLGGSEYFITPKNEVYQKLPSTFRKNAFVKIGTLSDFNLTSI
jgi:hypothetical protein